MEHESIIDLLKKMLFNEDTQSFDLDHELERLKWQHMRGLLCLEEQDA